MKIEALIEIIKEELPNNIVFNPLPAGSKWDDVTIFKRDRKICFWDEATTYFVNFDSSSKYRKYIESWCRHNFYDITVTTAALARTMTLAELLYLVAGGQYNTKNISKDFDKYVDKELLQKLNHKVKQKVLDEYDCSAISKMNYLIDILKNNSLYQELKFSCTFYDCCKNDIDKNYNGKYAAKNKTVLRFGNIKYGDSDFDTVIITAYDDFVELYHQGSGKSVERGFKPYNLDVKSSLTTIQIREQQIIAALDSWKTQYSK